MESVARCSRFPRRRALAPTHMGNSDNVHGPKVQWRTLTNVGGTWSQKTYAMRIFEDICSRRSPRKHRLESADVLAAINEEGLTDCEGTYVKYIM